MRDMPEHNGRCPIADDGPVLFPANENAVAIYYQARQSAHQVGAENGRTYFYVRPEAVESLLRMHDVPESERAQTLQRVLMLQDLENDLRPARKRVRQTRRTR